MTKQLSNFEEKAVLNTLQAGRERERKLWEKAEEKRWGEIKPGLALADYLAALPKHELTTIRTAWELKGVSSLKKEDLVAAMSAAYAGALAVLFGRLDETGYKVIKQVVDRGGHSAVNKLDNRQVAYFTERGLLFSGTYEGKKTVVMSREAIVCFKDTDSSSLRDKVRMNTEWIKLTQGMSNYYGCLAISDVFTLIKRYSSRQPSLVDLLALLEGAALCYEEITIGSYGVANMLVEQPEEVLQQQRLRAELDFYPFTKAQLLQAGEPEFVDRSARFRSFVQFIKANYDVTTEEAEDLVEECVYDIQLGVSINDLLGVLQAQLEIDNIELLHGFMNQLVALNNNTRQWVLKGYMPLELSRHSSQQETTAAGNDVTARKKVGRNDPCPCGSGKKFKKCCGQ